MTPVTATKQTKEKEEAISSSPVKLVDEIIARAFHEKASDIHVEPGEHDCVVRIRIDGGLVYIGRYRKEIHEEATARLKVLASLRTDVRNTPQDGRFRVNIANIPISVRISIIPSFHGEKSVLRLLPHHIVAHSLETLGFEAVERQKITETLSMQQGMVLVVGSTGSGKTTTLYSLLQKISKTDVSMVTLEDPVEYAISGVTQIPMNHALGFSVALRSVLRQDPDIIMVGEIRDKQTAELATHAALTGHLLLSTLHTNDAVTAIPRLIDMGIEPFLIGSTLRLVVAQRLVRKVCQKCKKVARPTKSEIDFIQRNLGEVKDSAEIIRSTGCAECRYSGYRGRTVISEILKVTPELRELINSEISVEQLRKIAIAQGMKTFAEDGIEKVLRGITSIEEIASFA